MKVLVLMSTYNGERYLQEQLDSLYAQTIPVDILVRDDGSTDKTCLILKEQSDKGKLQWYAGENLRPARSFWDLIKNAPRADFYCFCDQDDVWNNDKVERAIRKLQEQQDQCQPLLFCSNVMVADSELNPLRKMINEKKYTDFAHSLIYSLAPGCTFVFNHSARVQFEKYNMNIECEVIHDWLAHKIVSMLGLVIYDDDISMLYRQHESNVIGAKKDSIFKRVKRILRNKTRIRSANAVSLYNVYGDTIGDKNKDILKMVAFYRDDKKLKRSFLKCKDFESSNDFFLKLLIRFNLI